MPALRQSGSLSYLDDYSNAAILNNHGIALHVFAKTGQTLSGCQVEPPAMPFACHSFACELSLGERRTAVGAEILYSVEAVASVKNCNLGSALKLDGRASARRNVLDAPNRNNLALAARLSEIAERRDELCHPGIVANRVRRRQS